MPVTTTVVGPRKTEPRSPKTMFPGLKAKTVTMAMIKEELKTEKRYRAIETKMRGRKRTIPVAGPLRAGW